MAITSQEVTKYFQSLWSSNEPNARPNVVLSRFSSARMLIAHSALPPGVLPALMESPHHFLRR